MEGQIVDNDVKVFVGMGSIQAFEESQKDMTVVAVHAAGLHRALMHGERSQKTRGAVAGVGCRMPFGIPRSERKFRLSHIQRLYLRFLVHAQKEKTFISAFQCLRGEFFSRLIRLVHSASYELLWPDRQDAGPNGGRPYHAMLRS